MRVNVTTFIACAFFILGSVVDHASASSNRASSIPRAEVEIVASKDEAAALVSEIKQFSDKNRLTYFDDEKKPLYRAGNRVYRIALNKDHQITAYINNFMDPSVFVAIFYLDADTVEPEVIAEIDELAKSLASTLKTKFDVKCSCWD